MSRLFGKLFGRGGAQKAAGPALPTMHRVNSKSGWVRSAGYDPDGQALYVQFRDALVRYSVDRSYFYDLMHAASAGTYIHTSGLYKMPYQRLG
ncbi:MAG TPA: KTSC domain-containing protein [Gemmataceae bacterium]|nr:KTSC domain-containing protein [Gemmataceae bacterium]